MVTHDVNDPAKERIIELARARFLSDGFARVSVDEIVSSLGMSKKTFYKYFDAKEYLVNVLVDRTLGEVSLKIDGIISSHATFPAKLNGLIQTVGIVFRTISKQMIRDLQIYLPDTWGRIQAFRRDRIYSLWAALIEEGKRTGYIRPELNQRIFILALYSVVEGIVNPTVLVNESFSADEALENIVTILLKGILTEDTAREFRPISHTSQS
jgi:TetR/AcrR family transcriptional regulator, cholesterol catabolism regulator